MVKLRGAGSAVLETAVGRSPRLTLRRAFSLERTSRENARVVVRCRSCPWGLWERDPPVGRNGAGRRLNNDRIDVLDGHAASCDSQLGNRRDFRLCRRGQLPFPMVLVRVLTTVQNLIAGDRSHLPPDILGVGRIVNRRCSGDFLEALK